MSLSREIARWLQSSPGPLTGPDEGNVLLQAKMKFMTDRRWREEFTIAVFVQHLNMCGYKAEHRTHHGNGDPKGFWMLALPSRHKGF